AIQSHGTHVAGTGGCNFQTPATVDGVSIPYCPSGVAPRVFLGNYNVFPDNVADAHSEDILNALEAAYAAGMDIVNMSLGGGPGHPPPHAPAKGKPTDATGSQDLLTKAV